MIALDSVRHSDVYNNSNGTEYPCFNTTNRGTINSQQNKLGEGSAGSAPALPLKTPGANPVASRPQTSAVAGPPRTFLHAASRFFVRELHVPGRDIPDRCASLVILIGIFSLLLYLRCNVWKVRLESDGQVLPFQEHGLSRRMEPLDDSSSAGG